MLGRSTLSTSIGETGGAVKHIPLSGREDAMREGIIGRWGRSRQARPANRPTAADS